MLFSDTNLPRKLCEYLDEIYADEELKDAFYYSDVDKIGPESIVELMDDESLWLEPGEANYEMKPFAVSGDGGTWVILNDEHIGYVGSYGECGIVARNVDEFMNTIAVCKLIYFRMDDLKDEESFKKSIDVAYEEHGNPSFYDRFIEKHDFETDISKVYEMVKLGYTVKPFFVIKVIDEDYCDSNSLFSLDGQEALEEFIEKYL